MTFRIHCYIFGIDAERYYVCEGARILVEDSFEYIFSIYEFCKKKNNNDFLLTPIRECMIEFDKSTITHSFH